MSIINNRASNLTFGASVIEENRRQTDHNSYISSGIHHNPKVHHQVHKPKPPKKSAFSFCCSNDAHNNDINLTISKPVMRSKTDSQVKFSWTP